MGPMLCKPMLAVTLKVRRRLAAGQCDRGQHVIAARHAAGPAGDLALWAEHEHGRGAPDVEPPDQIQPVGHSISRWATPSVRAATSASNWLAARHGAQKDEENCSSVARGPRGWPKPVTVIGWRARFSRPSRRCQAKPPTAASTRTAAATIAPAVTPLYSARRPIPIRSRSGDAQAWAEAITLPPMVSSKV